MAGPKIAITTSAKADHREYQFSLSKTINKPINSCKLGLTDGQKKIQAKHVGYYLGYRALTCIMTPINIVYTVAIFVFALFTCIGRFSENGKKLNNWAWKDLCYSLGSSLNNVFLDTTYEIRSLVRLMCGAINSIAGKCVVDLQHPLFISTVLQFKL